MQLRDEGSVLGREHHTGQLLRVCQCWKTRASYREVMYYSDDIFNNISTMERPDLIQAIGTCFYLQTNCISRNWF